MTHFDSVTRTWSGPRQPPVFNPAISLGQVTLNILERTPDKVFEIAADNNESFTCTQLRMRMIRVALNLRQAYGLSKGDVVAMAVDNSPCVTPVLLGCILLGAPVHALHASFEESDLVHLMGITKPKLVFCNERNVATVRKSLEVANLASQIIVLNTPEADKILFKPVEGKETCYFPPYLGDSETTIAVIVCSSGTTSFPKAVCVSHAQLIAPYARITDLNREVLLCFSSLYWGSAFQMLMLTLFNGGTRITTTKPYSPAYASELIERYQVTTLFSPPPILAELVEHWELGRLRFPSLQIVGCGGSALPESVRKRANAVLEPHGRVYVGYSMSEFGGIIALDWTGEEPNSVGTLAPNVVVKVIGEDGALQLPNQEGEIYVRWPHTFVGYFGNEQETRHLLTEDGFIKSGDIGKFNERGYLYLTDRRKEMIRYQNFQIAPAQLEALLVELPEVQQAVVVGLPDPVPPHMDLATALVVPTTRGLTCSTQEQIRQEIDARVPDYKRLRGGVFFVEELPRTGNDKINRREAKKLALKLSQFQ